MLPTAKEQAALVDFRTFARDLAAGRPILEGDASIFTDHFLLRFLRARQLDKARAQDMLTAHFQWMEEVNPVALMSKPFPELPFVKRFYPTGYHGVDKRGRPVYIERLGKLDMARLLQHVTREQIMENFVRESERQVRVRFPACCLARGEVVDRSLNIIDLEGLSFRLLTHSMAKKVVKEIMGMCQDHYPEMCGNIVVINCPTIFSMAWSSLQSLLDENTIKKIAIYNRERSVEALLELVDADSLPSVLGGRCECECEGGCLSSNVGPWQRADIIEYLAADPDNHWKSLTPEGCVALAKHAAPSQKFEPNSVSDNSKAEAIADAATLAAASADGEPSEEEADAVSEVGSLRSPSAEEVAAQRTLTDLFHEHRELERRHLQTLKDWVHEYHELVESVGRTTIERAQPYYDAHFVNSQAHQDYNNCVEASAQAAAEIARLQEHSNKAEASFHAYLEDPAEASISEEDWKQMVPDEPVCPEDFREHGKLLRAWRMAKVSDRLAAAKRRAETFRIQEARVSEDRQEATRRVEEEEAKHRYCTWNCSVRRAESFFERRRAHEVNVDKTVRELQELEDKITDARAHLESVREHESGCAGGFVSEVSLAMSDGDRRMFEEELDFGRIPVNRAMLNAEAAKALAGGQLSAAEMLKLDETSALAMTLREEGNAASAEAAAVVTNGEVACAPTEEAAAEGQEAMAVDMMPSDAADMLAAFAGSEAGRKRALAKAAAARVHGPKAPKRFYGKVPMGNKAQKMPGALADTGADLVPEDEAVIDDTLESDIEDDEILSGSDDARGDDVLSALLLAERRRDQRRTQVEPSPELECPSKPDDRDEVRLDAYKTDLEYLVDAVELVARKGRLYRVRQKMEEKKGSPGGDDGQGEDEMAFYPPWERRRDDPQKDKRRARELEGQIKQLSRQIEERMKKTKEIAATQPKNAGWVPRLERILSSRQMNEFEKEVITLLVGLILLPSKLQHVMGAALAPGYRKPMSGVFVSDLLSALSPNLASQIVNRKSFYKDAVLVRDHMIHVGSHGIRSDLTSCPVEIDRRMVDFIVGLDSEVQQLVDGSQLYTPKTQMSSVVLPDESKSLIEKTVKSYALYRRSKKQFGLDDTILASGLVMLFYGDSGTGKTMTANAIANVLGKKLLLINFPSLGGDQAADTVRMIFRESKINDAVLFFDECESIFESRERSHGRDVNMLLTEIERHDGLIILATNRPFDLDEAMHRRITLAIEFHKPDHILRRDIWRSLLPAGLPMAEDVDLTALAMRYELSGGFIKNAILTALSIACSRAAEQRSGDAAAAVMVTHDDLVRGAQLQLRGRLAMRSFERRIVPKSGLDSLVCADSLLKKLQAVVDFEKSKTVLYSQWGFGGRAAFSGAQPEIGSCVLFYGPPGTGKSLAAQAIGFEVGRPLKVVNAANVLDKYVGETGKNIEKVFVEARAMEAILVFDEAEGLFGRRSADAASSVDKHSNLDAGLLLYWLEHYPGLCILTTNAKDAIDSAFFRRFRFMVDFPAPDRMTRARLWKSCIPAQAPRSEDVDFGALASEFERFSGGDIQNAVIRAASRAALRSPEEKRKICMADLREAAKEEGSKTEDDSLRRLYA